MTKKQSDGLSHSEMAFVKDPLNAPFPKSIEKVVLFQSEKPRMQCMQFSEDDRRAFVPAKS